MPEQIDEISDLELQGLAEERLIVLGSQRIHQSLYAALNTMAYDAAQEGYRLTVVSAWRSFDRQCVIWNEKAAGQRDILDDRGDKISRELLTDEQAMWAILRWSALPGASRHHWGTDIDVIDAAALSPGQRFQLTREEAGTGGIFENMHRWLDGYLNEEGCPFFRPYSRPDWGVAQEPWHLSYAPTAASFQRALTLDRLRKLILGRELLLKQYVLKHLDEIFERFVSVDWSLYPELYQVERC